MRAPTSWRWESIWSTRCRPRRSRGPWPGSTRRKLSHTPRNGVRTSARRPGPSRGTAVAVGEEKKERGRKNFIRLHGGVVVKQRWFRVWRLRGDTGYLSFCFFVGLGVNRKSSCFSVSLQHELPLTTFGGRLRVKTNLYLFRGQLHGSDGGGLLHKTNTVQLL